MNIYLLFFIIICSQFIKYLIFVFNSEKHNKMKKLYSKKIDIFICSFEILLYNILCFIIKKSMTYIYEYNEDTFIKIILFFDIMVRLFTPKLLSDKLVLLYYCYVIFYDHYIYSHLLIYKNFMTITILHIFIKLVEAYCIRIIYNIFSLYIENLKIFNNKQKRDNIYAK